MRVDYSLSTQHLGRAVFRSLMRQKLHEGVARLFGFNSSRSLLSDKRVPELFILLTAQLRSLLDALEYEWRTVENLKYVQRETVYHLTASRSDSRDLCRCANDEHVCISNDNISITERRALCRDVARGIQFFLVGSKDKISPALREYVRKERKRRVENLLASQ